MAAPGRKQTTDAYAPDVSNRCTLDAHLFTLNALSASISADQDAGRSVTKLWDQQGELTSITRPHRPARNASDFIQERDPNNPRRSP